MNTFEIIQNTTIIKVNYQGTQYKLVEEQDFASLTYTLFSANGKDIIDENDPLYDIVVEEFESALYEGRVDDITY
jgi:hypothetical protein